MQEATYVIFGLAHMTSHTTIFPSLNANKHRGLASNVLLTMAAIRRQVPPLEGDSPWVSQTYSGLHLSIKYTILTNYVYKGTCLLQQLLVPIHEKGAIV